MIRRARQGVLPDDSEKFWRNYNPLLSADVNIAAVLVAAADWPLGSEHRSRSALPLALDYARGDWRMRYRRASPAEVQSFLSAYAPRQTRACRRLQRSADSPIGGHFSVLRKAGLRYLPPANWKGLRCRLGCGGRLPKNLDCEILVYESGGFGLTLVGGVPGPFCEGSLNASTICVSGGFKSGW
jgi:hypothetical protein